MRIMSERICQEMRGLESFLGEKAWSDGLEAHPTEG